MAHNSSLIDSLLERVKDYSNSSIELIKLRAVDKTSDSVSSIVAPSIIISLLGFVLLFLNLALGMWLGEVFGKLYYGFLAIAGFYTVVCLILYFFMRDKLKATVYDALIKFLLK